MLSSGGTPARPPHQPEAAGVGTRGLAARRRCFPTQSVKPIDWRTIDVLGAPSASFNLTGQSCQVTALGILHFSILRTSPLSRAEAVVSRDQPTYLFTVHNLHFHLADWRSNPAPRHPSSNKSSQVLFLSSHVHVPASDGGNQILKA